MAKIRLVKKKTNEMSGTGGSASAAPGTGAQYASPKAFPRVACDYNKTFGTHFAPSIPNRPSKAITYKELWEIERDQEVKITSGQYAGNTAIVHDFDSEKNNVSGDDWVDVLMGSKKEKKTVKASELKPLKEAGAYESLAGILKQLGAEEDSIKVLLKAVEMGALKPSDAVTITKKALGMKESTDDADFDSATTGAEGLQTQNPLPIKEARYSEFKRTTQVRTPSEQMHRAVREIRRKIDEINKLVDYTEKMKSEMKSDVNEVRYLNRTKEALSKISAKVQETNNKIKRLVQ